MQRIRPSLALVLAITACSPEPTNLQNVAATAENVTAPAPAQTPVATPDYVGRWTGVEGMVLDVRAGASAGTYQLSMQYDLDHRQTAEAKLDGDALIFERDGKPRALRPTDGAATGLKYLAGKKDCLTVAPGEGYCRD